MFIEWRDELKIGIDEIDQQHMAIFEQFQHLYSLIREGSGHESVKDLLAFLTDYVHSHFVAEEILQEDIQYPNFKEHQKLHDSFSVAVDTFTKQFQDTPVTNQELIRFHIFIKDWLIHHIMVEDRKLGEYYLSLHN